MFIPGMIVPAFRPPEEESQISSEQQEKVFSSSISFGRLFEAFMMPFSLMIDGFLSITKAIAHIFSAAFSPLANSSTKNDLKDKKIEQIIPSPEINTAGKINEAVNVNFPIKPSIEVIDYSPFYQRFIDASPIFAPKRFLAQIERLKKEFPDVNVDAVLLDNKEILTKLDITFTQMQRKIVILCEEKNTAIQVEKNKQKNEIEIQNQQKLEIEKAEEKYTKVFSRMTIFHIFEKNNDKSSDLSTNVNLYINKIINMIDEDVRKGDEELKKLSVENRAHSSMYNDMQILLNAFSAVLNVFKFTRGQDIIQLTFEGSNIKIESDQINFEYLKKILMQNITIAGSHDMRKELLLNLKKQLQEFAKSVYLRENQEAAELDNAIHELENLANDLVILDSTNNPDTEKDNILALNEIEKDLENL